MVAAEINMQFQGSNFNHQGKNGGRRGDRTIEETAPLTTNTTSTSTPSTSPKSSKLKILCSHGGKILPRPIDGHLKYVGGETRVVALSRDITFSELMEKLTTTFEGDMVLKYQLIPEELDALVSIRTDDDLRHMVDEYERQESVGSPKLRAFLFPLTPIVVVQNQTTAGGDRPLPLEQRYIDAVNGIVRKGKLAPISVGSRPFSVSSACSSPKPISPEDDQESIFSNNAYQSNRLSSMHKVRSSPSLSSLDHQPNNNRYNNHSHRHVHPTSYQHHHHLYNNHTQMHKHHSSSSRPPQDPHRSSVNERLVSPMHNSRVDSLRGQMSCIPNSDYYHSHIKNPRAISVYGSTNTFQHVDDGGAYGYRTLDRADTLPRSPRRVLWD